MDNEQNNGPYQGAYTGEQIDKALGKAFNAAPANNPTFTGSISLGRSAGTSVGSGSVAIGGNAEASGDYSLAFGVIPIASRTCSAAFGFDAEASGQFSLSFGMYSKAKRDFNVAFGYGTIANEVVGFAIGRYNSESIGGQFAIGIGFSEDERANCFRVTNNGVYALGGYNASGADYAELFEWADGNPESADRVGRFVTLEGKNIRLAGPGDDYILGIVSGSPSVVGDVYDDQWQGMYLTDVFGRPVWEDVEVPAVTEEVEVPYTLSTGIGDSYVEWQEVKRETRIIIPAHTERRQKLNPDYDPNQPYVPRSERPEWDAVGMLGKLVAVDDGTCRADGWATAGEGGAATASEERTRFRVMERLDENHVRVMLL